MRGARYHKLYCRFWLASRRWTDDARLAGLYVLSCDHRNTEGLYRLPMPLAQHELGWTSERTTTAFDELRVVGFLETDDDADLVWIVKALRWDQPRGPKQVAGAVNALADIPGSVLRDRYLLDARARCPELAAALEERLGWTAEYPIEGVSDTPSEPYLSGIQGASAGPDGDSVPARRPARSDQPPEDGESPGQGTDPIPLRKGIEGVSDTPSIAQAPSLAPSQAHSPPPPVTSKSDGSGVDVAVVADGLMLRIGIIVDADTDASDVIELVAAALGRGWPRANLEQAALEIGAMPETEVRKTRRSILLGLLRKRSATDPTPDERAGDVVHALDFSDLTGLPDDPADEYHTRYPADCQPDR